MTKPGSSNIKKNEGPRRELKDESTSLGLKSNNNDTMPQARPSQKQSKIKLSSNSVEK